MTTWLNIINTAVIGVERQKLPELQSSRLGDRLSGLLAQLDPSDQEGALLNAAAAAALYVRAGRLPLRDSGSLPEPCAVADLPSIAPRAAQRLSLILNGRHTVVLEEWLQAAAKRGLRATEELLPLLLDLGRSRRELREAIQPVLGERGRWLARLNPDWGDVNQKDDETIWETGNHAQRLEFLKTLRSQDAARARELVSATWSQEAPNERVDFLKVFACGLSLDDESFLESALEDKRKEVRRQAADLLASLPQSGLCRRMLARVSPLLEYKHQALGRDLIEVALPAECDKSMLRDGVEPKPPHSQIGERAWLSQQMLAVVPPASWSERWGKTAPELVKAAGRSEWRDVLLNAWAAGAARHRDNAWLEALLDDKLREPTETGVGELFQALPPELQEIYCLKVARRNTSLNPDQPLHWLLNCDQRQWNEELSRVVLQSLAKHCADRDFQNVWAWSGFLAGCGRYLTAQLAGEAATMISKANRDSTELSPLLERFLDVLQFRAEMLREIDQ